MRKVAVFTGTRAEYGLLYWLLKDLQQDSEIELQGVFKRLEKFEDVPVVLVGRLSSYVLGANENTDKPSGVPSIYFSEKANNWLDEKFQAEFTESLIATACSLAKKHKVYLMRPTPEMGIDVPSALARNVLFRKNNEDVTVSIREYHERHSFVWEVQDEAVRECGVKILDPLPYLCDDSYCYGSKNGRPLYFDDDHLSEYGNKYLVPMFREVFSKQVL